MIEVIEVIEMIGIGEILCQARGRKRSIVDLCEHFGIHGAVQKESIRTTYTKNRR